jgi:hypothetical protein
LETELERLVATNHWLGWLKIATIEQQQQRRSKPMNLKIDLPADLEAIIKKRAEQAGLDIPAYVVQTLRILDLDQVVDTSITNEQFEASLQRLSEIHANVPAQFDDTRDSIYEGCGE